MCWKPNNIYPYWNSAFIWAFVLVRVRHWISVDECARRKHMHTHTPFYLSFSRAVPLRFCSSLAHSHYQFKRPTLNPLGWKETNKTPSNIELNEQQQQKQKKKRENKYYIDVYILRKKTPKNDDNLGKTHWKQTTHSSNVSKIRYVHVVFGFLWLCSWWWWWWCVDRECMMVSYCLPRKSNTSHSVKYAKKNTFQFFRRLAAKMYCSLLPRRKLSITMIEKSSDVDFHWIPSIAIWANRQTHWNLNTFFDWINREMKMPMVQALWLVFHGAMCHHEAISRCLYDRIMSKL